MKMKPFDMRHFKAVKTEERFDGYNKGIPNITNNREYFWKLYILHRAKSKHNVMTYKQPILPVVACSDFKQYNNLNKLELYYSCIVSQLFQTKYCLSQP